MNACSVRYMRSMQAAHVCAAIRKECLAQNRLLHGLPEAELCLGRQITDSRQQDEVWPYCYMHMQLATDYSAEE